MSSVSTGIRASGANVLQWGWWAGQVVCRFGYPFQFLSATSSQVVVQYDLGGPSILNEG